VWEEDEKTPTHQPRQPAQPTPSQKENNMSKLTTKNLNTSTREALTNLAKLEV
jgi:hypothetical protein